MSGWYQRAFPTRLFAQRQAVREFETTQQGSQLATSVGGVLTGRGADIIIIDGTACRWAESRVGKARWYHPLITMRRQSRASLSARSWPPGHASDQPSPSRPGGDAEDLRARVAPRGTTPETPLPLLFHC